MSHAPLKHTMPTVGIKGPRNYHDWYRRRIWWGPMGLRTMQLRKQPLCETCKKEGRVTVAKDVDHIKPHRGNWSLFADPENLQSLCKPCHSRKTAAGE